MPVNLLANVGVARIVTGNDTGIEPNAPFAYDPNKWPPLGSPRQ